MAVGADVPARVARELGACPEDPVVVEFPDDGERFSIEERISEEHDACYCRSSLAWKHGIDVAGHLSALAVAGKNQLGLTAARSLLRGDQTPKCCLPFHERRVVGT